MGLFYLFRSANEGGLIMYKLFVGFTEEDEKPLQTNQDQVIMPS